MTQKRDRLKMTLREEVAFVFGGVMAINPEWYKQALEMIAKNQNVSVDEVKKAVESLPSEDFD
ncbi:hypothetical protein EVB32_099 [Rhizobium phage RHph_TM39]|uniref:Uncharacterized protein n=1 Tax=Rhizobium phage RHph_TM30 TaxID=2509764 RepID=A0A7S5R9F9_9CAUD|nr:hypothetical protein PQC16_gp099 [Rhizobium phage RHph_TM30]QIG71570.1 hypothetical protein EVB94_099 [Rhizobium phage RHph_TM40]QIG71933.1 hypothetical protein EVB95_099 [Rhizobium phage RHph_TM2_3B]QIG72295.1 hypothetical protein EVB96_099 [Rhizobium phage RHph_TM3_3_6]QIG77087.1 hypothetical protein EVB32_099 [Rhizobium phage RHph_TM39]QIG77425.1 hypothetical protein EVB61_097 [Rhizobium phage RHph_TM21B]QIG77686.1 hypothetical protein EVB64_099 [Rhizobium phage RHph_TM61]